MNKSLFIKEEIRKTINIPQKGNKKRLSFNIYNYNDKSKQMILDIYNKKIKNGEESFDLTVEELRLVFNVFTDYLFDIDELLEIIETPNIYFEEIFHEIKLIMCDLVKIFLIEQKEKLAQVEVEKELLDLQEAFVGKMKEVNLDASLIQEVE